MAYNESVKNNKIEESHQHWTGHSHVNTDLGSKGNAKDKGHKAKSKAFNYQGQDQGLEMSWTVVKIKANNDHKIYMTVKSWQTLMTLKVCSTFLQGGATVTLLVKKLARQEETWQEQQECKHSRIQTKDHRLGPGQVLTLTRQKSSCTCTTNINMRAEIGVSLRK